MALWVDGNLVESTQLNDADLRNRISALRVKLDAGGRILRCITIGDETYWDEGNVPDPGQQDIYVQTCSYNEYVDEVTQDLDTFSKQLIAHLEGCAASWASGKDQEAFAAFSEATNGIDWVLQAGSNIYQFHHSESDLSDWAPFRHLQDQLQSLLSILEQSDSIEMADAVRYELIPAIHEFVENVTSD